MIMKIKHIQMSYDNQKTYQACISLFTFPVKAK